MNYAVMPMADYKAACDKLREKTETAELIKSGELPQKIDEVYREGQLSVFSSSEALQGKVEGNPISITDVSPVEHDLSVKLSSDTLTDFSSVKVTACGKNLFDKVGWIDYCNSISNEEALSSDAFLGEECFSYELNKKGSGQPQFTDVKFKENTQYTFSAEFSFSDKNTTGDLDYTVLTIGFADGGYEYLKGKASRNRFQKISYTTSKNRSIAFITFSWYGPGRRTYCKWLQIEEGTVATEYEEYREQTYTSNTEGIVEGVKSIYPSMSISAEGSVTISAEYYKDIDKVLQNLAINTALSGGE